MSMALLRSVVRSLGLGWVALVANAAAQPAADAAVQPAVGASSTAVELEVQQEVQLTPEEMLGRGRAAVESIEAAGKHLSALLGTAREQRDVVKVLCLDDKTNQIGVALSTARDRRGAMEDALQRGAEDRGRHEFTLLMVLKERVDVLVSEGNQCIGEEMGFTGDSEVDIEVDPNLPENDPETIPFLPVVAVAPGVSSPTD